ncbi:MAG TPA: hypothetical protein GX708_23480, partial [Gallicola sp.]|nr:hypothetical protein [Gallicola sp.]
MVATNSTIRQREGQWVVYNKLEHELRTPTIFFDKVERGAIRTIQPVASSVGIYKEFGGSKTYPENYNFKSGGVGWTVNYPEEISASFSSNNILGFDVLTSGGGYQPVYGDETNNPHVVIYGFRGPLNYLKSEDIPVPSGYTNEVDIRLDINASAPIWNFGSHQRVSVFAVKGEQTQVLTSNGFVDISKSSESEYIHTLQFEAGVVLAGELARVDTNSLALSGKLSDSEGLDGYSVHIRLYSSDRAYATIINFASINFAPTGDNPKGDLYKTTQGSNFTKQHDVETTIFGDYITSGLNGYFYKYPIDDTSNLFLPNGELASPAWATIFDTTKRPLLHHISRQKSRLFSVAHDILRANINVESFDPLAVFQDCKGGKYVVVSASFDFLRSEVDVELEQIAYDNTILKRDFIYSYFGEGESNIKSIGGIAGGGGGTGGTGGGGMTSEQLEMLTNLASWWKLDEDNDAIYSEKSIYSLKEVSAYGLGSGGGPGGGIIEAVYGYNNLGQTFNNATLTDTFNAYTINQINNRLLSV